MYSQNNEEQIIKDYFFKETMPLNSSFSVMDLGANDGETLSNSRGILEHFYNVGIQTYAVLVEPSPIANLRLCRLYKHRSEIYCFEKAIGSKNGKVILHDSGTHLNQGDTSLVSTIKPEEKSRWVNEKFSEVEVDCVTFETLLGLCPIKKFDFITLDIEGLDLEVLAQMDLKALGCRCICVEYNGKDEDKFDALITRYGLKQIHKNAENLIYAL